MWLGFLGAGLLLAVVLYVVRWRKLQQLDRPGFRAKWALPAFLIVALCGWFLAPSRPFTLDFTVLQGFNFKGGMRFSPEFSALLIALSVYTGAFIAEIVRSGIQSVVKGQREAARAIGLKESQDIAVNSFCPVYSYHCATADKSVPEPHEKNSHLPPFGCCNRFPRSGECREYDDDADRAINSRFCDDYGELSGDEFDDISSHELVQPLD